ncbi:MAG: S41 family peptidase [Firmicutes bacterium]|nr:S41 family peptidase [Bacillota bacterium]
MQKKRFSLSGFAPLLVTLAFLAGFFYSDLRTGDVRRALYAAQTVPQRVNLALQIEQDAQQGYLWPVGLYWDVLSRLRSHYYQPLNEKQLTYAAIRGMLASLHDPYTRFMDPTEYRSMQEDTRGDFFGIGAQLQEKEGQIVIYRPIEGSPADKAGIRAGDVIVEVDRKPVAGMRVDDVVKKIRGPRGTKVELTIRRKGEAKLLHISIVRDLITSPVVYSYMEDEKLGIGRIRLEQFNEKCDQLLVQKVRELEGKGLRALILDLRYNPGGLLNVAVDVASRFIDNGVVVLIQEKNGQITKLHAERGRALKPYPLVVLVNEWSASASEIVAGAIRDNKRGVIIGETTFGKGLVQTIFQLQDSSAVAITTAKYLTPSGYDLNRKVDPDGNEIRRGGIQPDIVVKQSEEMTDIDDRAHDVQLKKAVEYLREKLTAPKVASAL